MSNKIINGIDVSECCADKKMMKDGLYCFWEGGSCADNKFCYFKEIARLQEENKELKARFNELYNNAEQLANKYNKYDGNKKNELVEIINKTTDERNKYKQALEEISRYCEEQNLKADYTACEILTIIDKVLYEN